MKAILNESDKPDYRWYWFCPYCGAKTYTGSSRPWRWRYCNESKDHMGLDDHTKPYELVIPGPLELAAKRYLK